MRANRLLKTLFIYSNLFYQGNVYIADSGNSRIRKVTISTGIISTFAGTGASSYSGDGGEATSAALNVPLSVAVDTSGTFVLRFLPITMLITIRAGNVYIADQYNHRIRKVIAAIFTSTPR